MNSCDMTVIIDSISKQISDNLKEYYDTSEPVKGRYAYNFPPCMRYDSVSAEFAHLVEEAAEANSAYFDKMKPEDIMVELMDVIHVCETIIRMMDGQKLATKCKKLVIAKNRYRRYYESEA